MSAQTAFQLDESKWVFSRDANPTARCLFVRHYSYRPYADGRQPRHFVGPGEKTVLLTHNADALFVWRKFISGDGQRGINCAVFRNESVYRSADLIAEASRIAWERWPGERLYTYVNPRKLSVRRWHGTKRLYCPWPPGRCFIEAGWHYVLNDASVPQRTKHNKLFILERLPA